MENPDHRIKTEISENDNKILKIAYNTMIESRPNICYIYKCHGKKRPSDQMGEKTNYMFYARNMSKNKRTQKAENRKKKQRNGKQIRTLSKQKSQCYYKITSRQ